MTTIGAVLIVQNEEQDLDDCLQSLQACDEVVVVDGGSEDQTPAIASRYPNVRLVQRPFDGFASQWEFAIGLSTTDWFLQVAADERVPASAMAEMRSAAAIGSGVDALRYRFHFFAFGKPLRHGGYGSYAEVRFLRRAAYSGMSQRTVHEHLHVADWAVVAPAHQRLTHLTYATRQECYEKCERYAAGESIELRRSLRPGGGLYLLPFDLRRVAAMARSAEQSRTWRERLKPLKNQRPSHLTRWAGPPAKFLWVYALRLGFLDGRAGLYLAYMQARYIKRKYDLAVAG